ncbi:acyltransferase family protein [Marinomonas dokdonensis]|uniref:acyltransferase family protein n=1 Tax=Marinomonas dokdonensis TaxID=328224 RepID=UPI00405567AA
MNYRKEIDGLRAIAVISVIIYHANMEVFGRVLFKGGFFGVDIFFVLSGYLITGIIRESFRKKSFSFTSFYWRRVKRIIPAMIVMLLLVSVFAYFFLLPSDYVKYSGQLKSSLYFGSNFYFFGEDSYTSDLSMYKVLLHTWSLSLEWQFYLLFPVIVFFIRKKIDSFLLPFLVFLSMFSFLYSNIIVRSYPDLAFYLLPARSWEFTVGGIITFIDRKNILGSNAIYRFAPKFGLSLIFLSIFFIDHQAPHPSFITLIPILGTLLIIAYSHHNEFIGKLLSLKPIVYIGLISYSLYLWHNPIFVFFRFLENEKFNIVQLSSLLVLTLGVSIGSYHYVEVYFRKKLKPKIFLITLTVCVVMLFIYSEVIVRGEGLKYRLTEKQNEVYQDYHSVEYGRLENPHYLGRSARKEEFIAKCNNRTVDTSCKFGNSKWVLIGDSHAGQLGYALKEKLDSRDDGMLTLTASACPFVSPEMWFRRFPGCSIINKDRMDLISNFKSPKNFILAANYRLLSKSKKNIPELVGENMGNYSGGKKLPKEVAWSSYIENIKVLLDMGHTVYLIHPVPASDVDVKKLMLRKIYRSEFDYKTFYSDYVNYNKVKVLSKKLEDLLPSDERLINIYPHKVFCENKLGCKVVDPNGGLYNQGSHLSNHGAHKVLDRVFSDYDKISSSDQTISNHL